MNFKNQGNIYYKKRFLSKNFTIFAPKIIDTRSIHDCLKPYPTERPHDQIRVGIGTPAILNIVRAGQPNKVILGGVGRGMVIRPRRGRILITRGVTPGIKNRKPVLAPARTKWYVRAGDFFRKA